MLARAHVRVTALKSTGCQNKTMSAYRRHNSRALLDPTDRSLWPITGIKSKTRAKPQMEKVLDLGSIIQPVMLPVPAVNYSSGRLMFLLPAEP